MATMENPSSFFNGGGKISGNLTVTGDINQDPVRIGKGASVVTDATVVGVNASATGNGNAAAFGRNSAATGNDATALGAETTAPSQWNTVIGYGAGGANNGKNVVLVGRKSEATGDDAVAVGETAKGNATDATAVGWGSEVTASQGSAFGYQVTVSGQNGTAVGENASVSSTDATALGKNASASASGAVAIGKGTSVSQADTIGIGSRDFELANGNNFTYPTGVGNQTLVNKSQDGSIVAGNNVGYTLEVNGTTIATIYAESDGAGGTQNESFDIPVDLNVTGSTTEVDDVVTGDINIENGSQTTQFRFDATSSPVQAEILDGSQSNPAIAFLNDGDTGIFRNGGDDLRLVDNGSARLAINGNVTALDLVDLNSNDLEDSGTTIWDQSVGEIPDSAMGSIDNSTLTNSSLTVTAGTNLTTGGSVSLGSSVTLDMSDDWSTAVGPADDTDLEFGTGEDFRIRFDATNTQLEIADDTAGNAITIDAGTTVVDIENDLNFPGITGTPTFSGHDHSSGGTSTVPNSGLTNSSLTVSGGDGINGASISLGGSGTISVVPSNFAGSGLTTSGSPADLDVSAGTAIVVSSDNVNVDPADDETITWGNGDDMGERYDSANDSMRWNDTGTSDRMELDRTSGNLNIEGNLTEGANL